MIKYILRKVNNMNSNVHNKWFAYPVKEEMVELDKLADHMAAHNTPFSSGAIKGILTDMVSCIKELLLEGKSVKIPDLAIFYVGIKNMPGGAETEEAFNVGENVKNVRMLARATGSLSPKKLDLDVTLKRATTIVGKPVTGKPATGKE